LVAYKDGARVRLVSRNGRDHTRRFAGIAAAVAALSARSLVLDGEVAIYDQQLRSRFDWLREPDPDAVATPALLMAFDLLYQDGREFTGRRYANAARGWRTSSPAVTSCCPCDGSRGTVSRRGPRLSTKRACNEAGPTRRILGRWNWLTKSGGPNLPGARLQIGLVTVRSRSTLAFGAPTPIPHEVL
jgi:hypothetical protein